MRFMFGLVAILTSYSYGQPEIITEDVKLENRSLGINADTYDMKKADPEGGPPMVIRIVDLVPGADTGHQGAIVFAHLRDALKNEWAEGGNRIYRCANCHVVFREFGICTVIE